ncbi:hypothetical protein B5F98_11740 [Pseudoflavonifractor sp. An44]|uniref:hypothetical protein n=1 Tax=Pseudoflavonifractor sp. An44 TaxID=1965635 RepID=UPI000B3AE69E|nr:hypothetical protein [Pseudoflavonifractor sp. An44]OUN91831.1 hypothetical protein B5F98_11740 [Pseudoflavonifractor sp. An44]
MRYELEKYFSDPCESSGLLIAEAPTGYGKTYETIQAIYQYIAKGGSAQILFVTNLLKNLPADELRNLYEKNGRAPLFEKEVLVLSSAASSVEKAILTEKIPSEFQTDAYLELLSACQKKKRYQEQFGEAGKEITKDLGNQIREKLEPRFRHELEVHLQKTFPGGAGPRRDAIRNKEKYKWMAKFYPSIFWTEYKVLLLSVKKLMARNISVVEPSFECLSERMLKNKIVCIDEFDASRSVILDSLIDRALDLRADYLQLFLQVYRGAITHQISRELETVRKSYEADRTLTWERLLKEAQDIYQEGALYYSMKTVDTAIDKGRNFLFHDTSYHTVLDGNRTHIRAVCNQTEAQVQIHFEEKDEYYAHQDEPRIILQNLLRRIHVFLQRFQRYVYGWAESYAKLVNAGRQQAEDLYTIAAATESIFRQFDLTSEQTRLMSEELTDSKGGRSLQDVMAPDLSFYETGFRLFEFIDDDHHRAQTYFQYLQMRNTPENVLLYLCCQAKVVGLSATAAVSTVLGNYDLKYIKEQLKEHYHELSDETKASIQRGLETLWRPYKEGQIQVKLQVIDRGKDHLVLSERLGDIFSRETLAQKYIHRFTALGAEEYVQKRYCNILEAMKAFWTHSDIRAFLCLNQVLPVPEKRAMDENLLRDALKDLQCVYAPQTVGEMVILRSGDQFEESKDHLLQELQGGAKRFVLSSYQTLGAGQNLQYPIQDLSNLVTLNAEYDEIDPRFQKKDFDALYLGDVTHSVVNLNEDGPLSAQGLMKFCFQVECLYENDEISYRTLNRLLKDGIGRFSGRRPLNAFAQSILRQSNSVHGQITRDVIQAVGRMGRTFLKNPSVYLFTTEKTLYDLDLACLNGRILSPEMEALLKARTDLGNRETCIDYTHNEAERKATRGNAYILRMLNVDWTEETMALWKGLRQTVLQYPRAGLDVLNENPIIRTYYIPLAQDRHCYFYAQKGDFSEVILSFDQDKMQFTASLPEGLSPSTVSEEDARLAQILLYPGLKEHFIHHGWATEFGTDPYIMSPVLFQNIYKGALGEVAGKFILEKELGLTLQEIGDPKKFESFDFGADGDLFFDFKHWKWNMQVEERPMREKVLKKVDAVGGKRAFVVNLFSNGVSRPSCSNDGRLIEVPGILLPTGQVDQSALNYIRRFLL